jgi:hypothetical protein
MQMMTVREVSDGKHSGKRKEMSSHKTWFSLPRVRTMVALLVLIVLAPASALAEGWYNASWL